MSMRRNYGGAETRRGGFGDFRISLVVAWLFLGLSEAGGGALTGLKSGGPEAD